MTIGTGGVLGNITGGGKVAFTGTTSTRGQIGTSATKLASVTTASGKILTVDHNIYATTLTNSGTLAFNKNMTIDGILANDTGKVTIAKGHLSK